VRTHLAWLWDHISNPEHPIKSLGYAVQALIRHNRVASTRHMSTRSGVDELIASFKVIATSRQDGPRYLQQTLRLAEMASLQFQEIFRCAFVIGQRGFVASTTVDELLGGKETLTDFNNLRSSIASLTGEPSPQLRAASKRAYGLLENLRVTCFVAGRPIANLIEQFTSPASSIAIAATEQWIPKLRTDARAEIDTSAILQRSYFNVICPEELLNGVFEHFMINVRKQVGDSRDICLKWDIDTSTRGYVTYCLYCKGTTHVMREVQYFGLAPYIDRIREFGGDAGVRPAEGYSCVSWVSLIIWKEVPR
jgi:hypothetical protein